jgi:ribose 5-phosphate isomerase RpiB
MDGNGQVLNWSGRVLSAEDLRRLWNGQRELVLPAQTVVTPLAAEELRARGIEIRRQAPAAERSIPVRWGYAQDQSYPLVDSAIQALKRDGVAFHELNVKGDALPCRWAQAVARCVAQGECKGAVAFCADAGLVCCVANKLAGIRAVVVATSAQAVRAAQALGANLVAVEMPGRTVFEIRQILNRLCSTGEPACPPGVARTLEELDSNAHR